MYSGHDFAWIYDRQDQVSFLDGHVRAFAHFGGVVGRITFTTPSAATGFLYETRRARESGEAGKATTGQAAVRSYRWWSPPTCGVATIRPADGSMTGRDSGASLSRARCVRDCM
jgi:hypothetical protein